MRFHREGNMTLNIVLSLVLIASFAAYWTESWVLVALLIALVVLFVFMLQFFRNPDRSITTTDDNLIVSPADGRVVVIEEVEDPETSVVGKRIQISIFMSPLDVHINRVPISGKISYFKYHPGKYLVAWHPKSSTENERATFVLDSPHGQIVLRQIAGAVARRICSYPKVGDSVTQGDELGFIKFGSRCDILLPTKADVKVSIGDQVKGNTDVIATFGTTT